MWALVVLVCWLVPVESGFDDPPQPAYTSECYRWETHDNATSATRQRCMERGRWWLDRPVFTRWVSLLSTVRRGAPDRIDMRCVGLPFA